MSKNCWPTAVGLAVFMLVGSESVSHAEELLSWKLQAKQKFVVVIDQEIKTETTVNRRPVPMVIQMQMWMLWTVQQVDQQRTAKINQSITRIVVSMTAPGTGTVSYDSKSPVKPTGVAKSLASGLRPLVGANVQVTMTDRGEIQEVVLPTELSQAVTAQSQTPSRPQAFDPQTLVQMIKQSGITLPAEPIAVGQSWQSEMTTQTALGKLAIERTYTLSNADPASENAPRTIQLASEIKIVSAPKNADQVRLAKQEGQGMIQFDNKAGYVTQSEARQMMITESMYRGTPIGVKTTSTLKMNMTPDKPESERKTE